MPEFANKSLRAISVIVESEGGKAGGNNSFGFWVLPLRAMIPVGREKSGVAFRKLADCNRWSKGCAMRKSFKSSVAGALCAAMALTAMPTEVLAGPMSATAPADIGLTAPVETVHCRRRCHWRYVRYYHPRRYYRYGYRYDPAGAIFAGAALGLIGAGIAAATAPRYYGWGYPYGGWW